MKLKVIPLALAASITSSTAFLAASIYLLYSPFKLNLPFPKLAAPIPAIGGLLGKKMSASISTKTFFSAKQFIMAEFWLFIGTFTLAALFAVLYNLLSEKID